MFSKIIHIVFLCALAFFIYNMGDFQMCAEDKCCEEDHHESDFSDCSCVFCISGLMGVDVPINDLSAKYDFSEYFVILDNDFNFGEVIEDHDQPPRA